MKGPPKPGPRAWRSIVRAWERSTPTRLSASHKVVDLMHGLRAAATFPLRSKTMQRMREAARLWDEKIHLDLMIRAMRQSATHNNHERLIVEGELEHVNEELERIEEEGWRIDHGHLFRQKWLGTTSETQYIDHIGGKTIFTVHTEDNMSGSGRTIQYDEHGRMIHKSTKIIRRRKKQGSPIITHVDVWYDPDTHARTVKTHVSRTEDKP